MVNNSTKASLSSKKARPLLKSSATGESKPEKKGSKRLSFAKKEFDEISEADFLLSALPPNSEIVGAHRLLLCTDAESPRSPAKAFSFDFHEDLDQSTSLGSSLEEMTSIEVNSVGTTSSSVTFEPSTSIMDKEVSIRRSIATISVVSSIDDLGPPSLAALSIEVPPLIEIAHVESRSVPIRPRGTKIQTTAKAVKRGRSIIGKHTNVETSHHKAKDTNSTPTAAGATPTSPTIVSYARRNKQISKIDVEFLNLQKQFPNLNIDRAMRKTIIEAMKNMNYWSDEDSDEDRDNAGEGLPESPTSEYSDSMKSPAFSPHNKVPFASPTSPLKGRTPKSRLDHLAQPTETRNKVHLVRPKQIPNTPPSTEYLDQEKQNERDLVREQMMQKAIKFLIKSIQRRRDNEQMLILSSTKETFSQRNVIIKRMASSMVDKAVKSLKKHRISKLEKRKYKEKKLYKYKIKVSYYLFQCWRRFRIRCYIHIIWQLGKKLYKVKILQEEAEHLEYRKRVAQRKLQEDVAMRYFFHQLEIKHSEHSHCLTDDNSNEEDSDKKLIIIPNSWDRQVQEEYAIATLDKNAYPGTTTTSIDARLFSQDPSICRPDLAPFSTRINDMITNELYTAEIAYYMQEHHRMQQQQYKRPATTNTANNPATSATTTLSPPSASLRSQRLLESGLEAQQQQQLQQQQKAAAMGSVGMASRSANTIAGIARQSILRPAPTTAIGVRKATLARIQEVAATTNNNTVVETIPEEENITINSSKATLSTITSTRKPIPPSMPKSTTPQKRNSTATTNSIDSPTIDPNKKKSFVATASAFIAYNYNSNNNNNNQEEEYYQSPQKNELPQYFATSPVRSSFSSSASSSSQAYSDFVIPRRPTNQTIPSNAIITPSPRRKTSTILTSYTEQNVINLPFANTFDNSSTLNAMNQYYKTHFDDFANLSNIPTIDEIKTSSRYKSPAFKALEKILGYNEEEIKRKSILSSASQDQQQQQEEGGNNSGGEMARDMISNIDRIIQQKMRDKQLLKPAVFFL